MNQAIAQAVESGKLLESSKENIEFMLRQAQSQPWISQSIEELVNAEHWSELNDRFYKTLSFGTGGLRGRTIGKVVTSAEQGQGGPNDRPQYPAVGTNSMNDFNVSRATQGLVTYVLKNFPGEQAKVCIAHDSRHFSRQFAELAADIISTMGGIAYLFEEERSTPELSFSVRLKKAHAGIMLTASHNPPHDNGYKVYFQDGGQIVEPHASGIIHEVLAVSSPTPKAAAQKGDVIPMGSDVDEAYIENLKTLVLEPEIIRQQSSSLKMVFTPLHGTGGKIIPTILEFFGFKVVLEPEQSVLDGRFPTVKSPNPEYPEALRMGVDLAKAEGADIVFGTDPDADRMGVAVRNREGEFEMLTGNMIGSVMAAYRLDRMFEKGWINGENSQNAALIKTFVTTDLQKEIAHAYGVKCVETLTGFKYIGEKLRVYEDAAGGRGEMPADSWREKLLSASTFFIFGGEESYGYSGGDYVRDKDANAAVLMCAEAAAYACAKGMTLPEYLDELYLKYGFYLEKLGTLQFEGAEGAAKIRKLLETYTTNPPQAIHGKALSGVDNFSKDDFQDVDGKPIPKELMLMFHLEGGFRVAVRGSGTEPKIKYYFFGREDAPSAEALASVKGSLREMLDAMWEAVQADVKSRVG